ncbi:membrane metallo-endopeptidase-like 1 [Rhipicephalus microplus]|uniref:membrane metallo-endopeptidase-like 1 n=1 Tax=Rhipicephalus microplus TaxID=6941 RepID=UPI003F6D3693
MCAAAERTAAVAPDPAAAEPFSEEWETSALQPSSWTEEREVFAYLLTLMAVLTAVITVVNNLNGKGVSPVVLEPRRKLPDATTTVLPRSALEKPPYDVCVSRSCQAEGRYLVDLLTWEYDPCENFYGFVCQGWRQEYASGDTQLRRDLELRLSALLRRASTSPPLEPLRRLYSQCSEVPNHYDVHALRQALSMAGLPDWPYAVPLRQTVSIWSIAAQVIKLAGAHTLLNVVPGSHSSRPEQSVLRLGPPNLINTTSGEALSAALGAFRPRLLVPLYAAELSGLEQRLLRCRPSAVHLTRLAGFPQIVEFLGRLLSSGVHEGTEVLLETDGLRCVLATAAATPADTVLNFMGLRFLLRLAYLLPDKLGLRLAESRGPRWRGCLLQLEPALPHLFLLASIEAVGTPSRAAKLAEDVRRALVRALPGLSWLSPGDRRKAAAFLGSTNIRLFMPEELRNGSAIPTLPPHDLDVALLAYCRLHSHAFEHKLRSADSWQLSSMDTDCMTDVQANRVDVPLLMFNRSAVKLDELQSIQLPRAGFRLARCLLRLLFSWVETDATWDEGVRARRCLARQYGTTPPPVEDSLALAPVLRLFRDNLRHRHRRMRQDLRLRNAEDLSLEQLFFIYFALGFCQDRMDAERRTNVALWNTPSFHSAYECRAGSPMRPDRSCILWVSL